jgi:hypothetical protein
MLKLIASTDSNSKKKKQGCQHSAGSSPTNFSKAKEKDANNIRKIFSTTTYNRAQ